MFPLLGISHYVQSQVANVFLKKKIGSYVQFEDSAVSWASAFCDPVSAYKYTLQWELLITFIVFAKAIAN